MVRGVVQLSDLHCPHVDKPALQAVTKFIAQWKPERVVLIGDALNLSGISRHVQNDLIEQVEDRVDTGLSSLTSVLDDVVRAAPGVHFDWIWGNHDERLRAFVQKNPSWRGIIDEPLRLLKEFGGCRHTRRIDIHQFVDYDEDFSIGRMAFVHGHYLGKHPAAAHVEAYGQSVTFGHTHTMQMFTTVRKGLPVAGYTIGHLMSKEGKRYMKGRPDRWVTGFAYMEYDDKTGIYTQHLIPIVEGQFCFAGKLYSGNS